MSNISSFLAAALMMGGGPLSTRRHREEDDPLAGIDLMAEYKLIQQKRSKLSANQRREVVWRVEQALADPTEEEPL